MNVKYTKHFNCVVCGNTLDKVLNLHKYPITDIYIDKPESAVVDEQHLAICPNCGHSQLTSRVDSEILYSKSYAFKTTIGGSTKVNNKLLSFIGNKKFDRIVEVGCNDCYLLNSLRKNAPKLIGIDPILKGKEYEFSDNQLTVFGDFIENIDLEKKDNTLYITSHALEHFANPRSIIESLLKSAGKNCLFVFQFPGFDTLLQDYRFDQVYNHHLHYFSLYSFNYLLENLGCKLLSYEIDYSYWGTLLVSFEISKEKTDISSKKIEAKDIFSSFDNFNNMMQITSDYINSFKLDKIYGYGAALQVPVLSYFLKNDLSNFEFIIDDDINKNEKYFFNLPVKICYLEEKNILEDSIVVVTAINFSREIILDIKKMNPKKIIILSKGI